MARVALVIAFADSDSGRRVGFWSPKTNSAPTITPVSFRYWILLFCNDEVSVYKVKELGCLRVAARLSFVVFDVKRRLDNVGRQGTILFHQSPSRM